MDAVRTWQPRQKAALALAVLFFGRCLWLPAHLAFEHHQAPGARATALSLAHSHSHHHGHDHAHGHTHPFGFGHDHDPDPDRPGCPEEPPHSAADHQPDMRAPRGLQGVPAVEHALPLAEMALAEPTAHWGTNAPSHEPRAGRPPPARPQVRAPPA